MRDWLGDQAALVAALDAVLGDELPLLARDGGFVKAGHHAGLDEFRALRDESRRHIAALQDRYAAETGVPGLKNRHTNVLGRSDEHTSELQSLQRKSYATFCQKKNKPQ